MAIYVTHPALGRTGYDYDLEPVFETVSSVEEAMKLLDDAADSHFRAQDEAGLTSIEEGAVPMGETGVATHGLFSFLPAMPWHISFYEHVDYRGDNFRLGTTYKIDPVVALNPLILSSLDWEFNLADRSWNDRISSVKCHSYEKPWVLFEHANFQGEPLFGSGSNPNLHNLLDRNGVHWGDRVSSILMSSIAKVALQAGLESLKALLPNV